LDEFVNNKDTSYFALDNNTGVSAQDQHFRLIYAISSVASAADMFLANNCDYLIGGRQAPPQGGIVLFE
jgi:hypothetical protein